MKKPSPAPAGPKKPAHRLWTALQTTGRLGKSTILEAAASWARFAGIPFSGADLDSSNSTFSDRLNGEGQQLIAPPPSAGDGAQALDAVFRFANQQPVFILDVPAGATGRILEHMEAKRVQEALKAKDVRMTVFLFASPDPTAGRSMGDIYQALKGEADFILVRNPARFDSTDFDQTRGAKILREAGVPELTMPPLSDFTLREVTQTMSRKQRFYTLDQVRQELGIDSRLDVDAYLGSLYARFEDLADILVPAGASIRQKIERADRPASPRNPNADASRRLAVPMDW